MNKAQRNFIDTSKAVSIAIQALERIEMHEKECGARWSEAVSEIKSLRTASDANSARWEKLAWTVIGTVIATALPSILHLSGVF
tara:strand:+ start:242 stop:493 length:252 start_codon:yes stop_codon:yes gene_type:complete